MDGRLLTTADRDIIKISADYIDKDSLKSKIIETLLEDPDSEVIRIAENYLIQCLYDATNDPENNPILQKFFEQERQERIDLWNELCKLKNEFKELKEKLGLDSYYSGQKGGVAWKDDLESRCCYLEDKLINIVEKLGKAGININYWEN